MPWRLPAASIPAPANARAAILRSVREESMAQYRALAEASGIIARSRLGRRDGGSPDAIGDTSAGAYAEGTVERLRPGMSGAAAAAPAPHIPAPARKRAKSRAT